MQLYGPMSSPPNQFSVPDASSSTGQSSTSSSSGQASRGPELAPTSRYVLPVDLEAAIKHLDDQELDRLVSAALEERNRRKRPLVRDKIQRNADAISSPLPQ